LTVHGFTRQTKMTEYWFWVYWIALPVSPYNPLLVYK
jgi:hypothetical protein